MVGDSEINFKKVIDGVQRLKVDIRSCNRIDHEGGDIP